MTLGLGLDSASAPTLAQARAARAAGYTWWGFYLPRLPNTDPLNGWTVAQMDVLRQAGIIPVPICVPAPPAPADPVQTATEYVQMARQYGLNPTVAICYNGEHISAAGPVWLPIPGPQPATVGPGSAIQWGAGTPFGIDVDLNVSAPDFPAAAGLVCDLEYNVAYTAGWYATFQQTVAALSPQPDPPTPDPPDPQQEENMWIFECANEPTILVVGGLAVILPDAYDVSQLRAAGAKDVPVDAAFMERLKTRAV